MERRRLVAYDDIAPSTTTNGAHAAATSAVVVAVNNGDHGNGKVGKQPHWTADGKPISASAARQYRRVLQLCGTGQVEEAEALLLRMDTAKTNVEIKQALAWAKRKQGQTVVVDEREEEEDEGEEEEDVEEVFGVGTSIDVQGLLNDAAQSNGKGLTHAEIWDDSALIDAWDAAMEEYKMFDAQRTAHRLSERTEIAAADERNKRSRSKSTEEEDFVRPVKRSALWYNSPDVGSHEAQEARVAAAEAANDAEKEKAELDRRKSEARALLNQIAPQESVGDGNVEGTANARSKKRVLKGIKPPSSHLVGNPAWHSACAVVSQTPNEIGQSVSESSAAEPASSSSSTTTTEREDVLQNLAMAWYYAGYYQAMANDQLRR